MEALDKLGQMIETWKTQRGTARAVSPYGYNALFGNEQTAWKKENGLILLLCQVFLLAGMFPYEKKNKMAPLLRASLRGRNLLWRKKIMVGLGMTGILWLSDSVNEIWCILSAGGSLGQFAAPYASLLPESRFPEIIPSGWPIGAVLLLYFLLRLAVLWGTACLFLLLSVRFRKTESAALGGILLIAVLAALPGGTDILSAVSVAGLWNTAAAPWGTAAVYLAAGGAAAWMGRRMWMRCYEEKT